MFRAIYTLLVVAFVVCFVTTGVLAAIGVATLLVVAKLLRKLLSWLFPC